MKISLIRQLARHVSVASLVGGIACSGALPQLGNDTDAASGSAAPSTSASTASGTSTSSGAAANTGANGTDGSAGSLSSSSSSSSAAPSGGSSSSSGSSSPDASTASSSTSSGDASVAPDAHSDATAPLSFANDVYPIIAARCLGCHVPGSAGVNDGHLDMMTGMAAGAYTQLVGKGGNFGMVKAQGDQAGTAGLTCADSGLIRVVPGSSLTSLLYQKVLSKTLVPAIAPCGNPMPANEPATVGNPTPAPPLTTAQIATIRSWIDEGANP